MIPLPLTTLTLHAQLRPDGCWTIRVRLRPTVLAALGWAAHERVHLRLDRPGAVRLAGGAGRGGMRIVSDHGPSIASTRRMAWSFAVPGPQRLATVTIGNSVLILTLPPEGWSATPAPRARAQERAPRETRKTCLGCGRPVDHPSPTIRLCAACGARVRGAAWDLGA